MSNIYDNWERLVDAVLKREELRRIALLDDSRESSFNSISSSDLSFGSSSITVVDGRDLEIFQPFDHHQDIMISPSVQEIVVRINFTNDQMKQTFVSVLRLLNLHVKKTSTRRVSRLMRAVSRLPGIQSIAVDRETKKLTVTGDFDPICMMKQVRKFSHAEILTVASKPTRMKKN